MRYGTPILLAVIAVGTAAVSSIPVAQTPSPAEAQLQSEVMALRKRVEELSGGQRRAAVVLPSAVGCSPHGPAPGEAYCDPQAQAVSLCREIGYPKARRVSQADAPMPVGIRPRLLENVACHD